MTPTKPPDRPRAAKPPSDNLLAIAAEERAAGAGWAAVAARLGRGESAVRRWPRKYPDRWLAALLAAERRQALDSGAESVLALRNLLRTGTDALRLQAAKTLLALRVDLAKLEVKAAAAAPARPALSPEAARFLSYLDGHPDDELAALVRDLAPLALPAGRPGPGVAPPGAGPG